MKGARTGSGLPPALKRFWAAMAGGTALSIGYTATIAYRYRLAGPYGLPLLWGKGVGMDFMLFYPGFSHFGTSRFWDSFDYPFTYPAPLAVVFGWLFRLAHPVRAYLLFCLAAIALGAAMLVRWLVRLGVGRGTAWAFTLTNLAMAWPLLLLFDTANIEGLVAVVLAAGVAAALCERWWLAAALIGAAGSMKLFPLVLLGLLLGRRRYREFAAGLAVAVALTAASLSLLGPSMAEAQRRIDVGLNMIANVYFYAQRRNPYDHSLWLPLRHLAAGIDGALRPLPAAAQAARARAVMEAGLKVYLVAVAVGGVALFFARIRKLPMLNQVLALTVCAVLLPPLSIDYTLVHLLLPFGLLCAYATEMGRSGVAVTGLTACLGCFVAIFNSETFLMTRYTYAAEARTLGLVALLAVALRHRFAWPALDSAGERHGG